MIKLSTFKLTNDQRRDFHNGLLSTGIASAFVSIGYNLLSDNEKKEKAVFETVITVTGISTINQIIKYIIISRNDSI